MSSFRLLTYNIHKGFSLGNSQFVLEQIKNSVRAEHADIVCLQEVLGQHKGHLSKVKNYPTTSQFEFLADQTWSHYAYGKNAVYEEGHHGNAILSKYPITSWSNDDVSFTKHERRGLLHTVLEIKKSKSPVHIFCVHLGLFEKDRKKQILMLAAKIKAIVPDGEPVIIAGDFNDWRENASDLLLEELKMDEVFLKNSGKHAATFPALFPLLALDRIYYKNIKCVQVEVLQSPMWRKLSDHLPISAEFKF